jgi:hypothetical protein
MPIYRTVIKNSELPTAAIAEIHNEDAKGRDSKQMNFGCRHL